MGSVVGEKVTRAAEGALAERVPLIVVSASGRRPDAGRHAGPHAARQDHRRRSSACGRPASRTSPSWPTRRPVASFASFAALGDVNVAEPNALIGFAGARVSAGTIAEELPAGFQRAEFLFDHGFVDRIVPRAELRGELAAILDLLAAGRRTGGDAVVERLLGRSREREAVAPAPPADPARRRVGPRPARPEPAPAAYPGAGRGNRRRVRGAPRGSPLRRRRGDRRRHRPDRRPAGRHRRSPEGRRHGGEHPAQLRDGQAGGLPQGYAPLRAGRAVRAARRHVRGHTRGLPGSRGRGARDRRGDRPVDHASCAACGSRSSRSSPARAAPAGPSRSPSGMSSSPSRTPSTRSSAPEGCASILWRTAEKAADAALAMRMSARRPGRAGGRRPRRPRARRGRPCRADRRPAGASGRSSSTQLARLSAIPPDELVALRARRYRALGAFSDAGPAEAPPSEATGHDRPAPPGHRGRREDDR